METLRIDDFTNYVFLSNLEFSPDGKHACFVHHKADMEENAYKSNLWLYRLEDSACFQLTAADKEKGFIWLDDSNILFPGMRDPKDKEKAANGEPLTVFYRINIHGGEATEAFRLPLEVRSFHKAAGDKYVMTVFWHPGRPSLEELSDQEKAVELKKRKEEQAWETMEEIPYWSNGAGFTAGKRSRLCIYDAGSGKWEFLGSEKVQVQNFRLNADKNEALVLAQEFVGKMEVFNFVFVLDIASGKLQPVTSEEFSWQDVHYVDGQLMGLGRDMEKFGLSENPRFYLIDRKTGDRQLLTPDFDCSTWNSVGSDCRLGGGEAARVDEGFLYFMTNEGYSSYINRIDTDGNITKITEAGGSVDSFDVRKGQVLFIGMRELRLQELYRLADDAEEKITSFNDWVHKDRSIAKLEHMALETEPGVTIDGWVMQPVEYKKGKKHPAILNIHGGPKTVYGETFFHEMQYWANQGYFVLFCNPRGSDGKGNAFADIRGAYGTIDYDDIMAFTDEVLKRYPDIDSDRLGVTGGSYGGFMTNWIIGHTHRFRAAAAQRSISNWVSMGYTADIGYFFVDDQVGTSPWDDIEKVWWHSPLKYADRVKTPTLFIHSDQDYRCWTPEALQMFTALKYFGVESRLCLFKGENHELSRSGKPKNRIRRLQEITQWFDRHLK